LAGGATVVRAQAPAKPATKPVKREATPEEKARKAAVDAKRLEEEVAKMTAVLPEKAPAQPKKPRKLLVYNLAKGFVHDSIPLGAKTFEALGMKTGAFQTTVTDDPGAFTPENLQQYDAVMMNNTTGDNLPKPEQKKALLDFVKGGKGIAGIHSATDAFYNWPEYGEMMGGYFAGHPFGQITVKLDDPASPINAVFDGKGFDFTDEIYTFRTPYSREKLHILLSLDWDKSAKAQAAHWKGRPDHDYALSWIHCYGEGRVFYCAFGHQHQVFWNPTILKHYLAGIQYVLGDLAADAAPSVKK
jgi:type 1 glutamine amidotransferase